MKEGPVIASVAALLGDPARANILTALMDGRALTVSELAEAAGVTLQTASGHLAKLDAANLLIAEKQGRHRYFRLSGPDVAQVLEALMGLAQRTGATRVRTGSRDAALRSGRMPGTLLQLRRVPESRGRQKNSRSPDNHLPAPAARSS